MFIFFLPGAFGGIHRDVAYRRKLSCDFSSSYGSCGCEMLILRTARAMLKPVGEGWPVVNMDVLVCLGQLYYYIWHSSGRFFHEW